MELYVALLYLENTENKHDTILLPQLSMCATNRNYADIHKKYLHDMINCIKDEKIQFADGYALKCGLKRFTKFSLPKKANHVYFYQRPISGTFELLGWYKMSCIANLLSTLYPNDLDQELYPYTYIVDKTGYIYTVSTVYTRRCGINVPYIISIDLDRPYNNSKYPQDLDTFCNAIRYALR